MRLHNPPRHALQRLGMPAFCSGRGTWLGFSCPAQWKGAARATGGARREPPSGRVLQCRATTGAGLLSELPAPPDAASPAVVLAGFWLEELAGVRLLLDKAGGEAIRVVPCNPELLHQPLRMALLCPEHAWHEPIPEVQDGGGWGADRVLLCSGLSTEAISGILEIVMEAGITPVVAAAAEDYFLEQRLGEVLAEAVQAHRESSAAGNHFQQAFVDELPPIEDLLEALPKESVPAGVAREDLDDLNLIDDIAAGKRASEARGDGAGLRLSRAQVKSATEEMGLDVERFLRDAEAKGIRLTE